MATIPKYSGTATWKVDELSRLRRFLRLGTDNGSYYTEDKDITKESAACIESLIADGKGAEVVAEIVKAGKEAGSNLTKQKPVIFALAYCAKLSSDTKVRRAASQAVHDVCNIPTQLFTFVDLTRKLSGKTSGWGRSQRKAIAEWYNKAPPQELANAVTQFRQKAGWSHVDILRLAHVKPVSEEVAVVLKYVSKGLPAMKEQYKKEGSSEGVENLIAYLEDVETVKHTEDEQKAARLIEERSLSREHIPTWMVGSKEVWRALLQHMPYTTMLTHLGKMSAVGILDNKGTDTCAPLVIERLQDEALFRESKLQPFSLLLALKTYEKGKAEKGKLTWTPNPAISDHLSTTFYKSFKNALPTNKRYVLAVDVSGSMQYGSVVGCPQLTPNVAAAAYAMLVARSEQAYDLLAFSKKMVQVRLDGKMSLEQVCQAIAEVPMGGTDCSQPIKWALDRKKEVDVFMVFTDCETWTGEDHPADVLRKYRTQMKLPEARLIVCALTSSGFSLGDPQDAGMLDIAGFDAAVPHLVRHFVMGEL